MLALIFGLVYAGMFLTVAFRFPVTALAVLLALTPVQWDLGFAGVRFSITEVNLLLMLPVLLGRDGSKVNLKNLGSLKSPVYAYLGVCLLSSLITWRGASSLVSIAQMILYMVITPLLFLAFVPVERADWVVRPVAFAGTIWALVGFVTNFQFLGSAKNAFGAVLATAILVTLNLWFSERNKQFRSFFVAAMAFMTVALVLTLSRGAWLGLMAGLICTGLLRRKMGRLGIALLILTPLVLAAWNSLPQQSRDYAFGFGMERGNIKARYASIQLAEANFHQQPIWGVGVGLRKEYDATNVVLSTLAETGVMGLATFALIFASFYLSIFRASRKLGTDDPLIALLALGGSVMICRLAHGMVDHYWTRGAITVSWAGAGLAVAAVSRIQMGKVTAVGGTIRPQINRGQAMGIEPIVARSGSKFSQRGSLNVPARRTRISFNSRRVADRGRTGRGMLPPPQHSQDKQPRSNTLPSNGKMGTE